MGFHGALSYNFVHPFNVLPTCDGDDLLLRYVIQLSRFRFDLKIKWYLSVQNLLFDAPTSARKMDVIPFIFVTCIFFRLILLCLFIVDIPVVLWVIFIYQLIVRKPMFVSRVRQMLVCSMVDKFFSFSNIHWYNIYRDKGWIFPVGLIKKAYTCLYM